MLPTALLLLVFLTYPLGLGVWLGFTDTKIGRPGAWIGLDNFTYLAGDSLAQLALFNTIFYTVIASVLKFALGLWLALLLNKNLPFKSFFRPWCCCRGSCRRRCRRWLSGGCTTRSSRSSAGRWSSWADRPLHRLPGRPVAARFSTIAANVWRGIPFVAISLLAGLQTISPTLYEAASIDGATPWQQFRHVTLPLLTPIIAVVMTFSVLFTFTDFQLIYVLTRGGPLNATHLMATLSFQRAIPGGSLGEGAALATMMVPFLLAAIMFSYFGLQRRGWQQGGDK
jgi:multiple sugar transport system permease protein